MCQLSVNDMDASRQDIGHRTSEESAIVQARLAEASVEVDTARILHRCAIRELFDQAEQGQTPTNLERACD